ncbi:MAG: hypothetical protein NTV38_08025 [Chloroflexi bacterium]|nr:hypothetical protein [Chloroflexota bacterium]
MAGGAREVATTSLFREVLILKKLEKDYDPTDRWQALRMMEEAQWNNWMVTGLIYVETGRPALTDLYNQPETPLNRLGEPDMRLGRESLEKINATMF